MCDKFFGPFFCSDHISVCDADDDTNYDYRYLWTGII